MQLFYNKWTAGMNEIFDLLRSTMTGERSPDMEGTGEIKYPGQTKTSTAALRLREICKGLKKKTSKTNHLVLQVGGYAKGQLPIHGNLFSAKDSQRRNGTGRFNGQRNMSNKLWEDNIKQGICQMKVKNGITCV